MCSAETTSEGCACCCGCGSSSDKAASTIINLVLGKDERTNDFMPGWDVEIAHQKMIFLSKPSEFLGRCEAVCQGIDAEFDSISPEQKTKAVLFLLGVTDSLNSIVELHHNLQNEAIHGTNILSDTEVENCRKACLSFLNKWANSAPEAAQAALRAIKTEDLAVNKGDNLFIAWAKYWEAEEGADPYGSIENYLKCFSKLYSPETYYVSLFLAWEKGETKTQFFNDYGLQAARCRKIGSLGGTTNPAIAVLGEDDMAGKGNIWGEEATRFIVQTPNKWTAVRAKIAKEQVKLGEADDWGATEFTVWVVVDAMLGLRSVFLLQGLGRVAFQLRPDWHADEKKLAYAAGSIYEKLCNRIAAIDEILLEGVDVMYLDIAKRRIGKANNHFKVSCTSQTALNLVKAINAGRHPEFPDAIKERMWTNMTLSYDVSQMVASSLAVEEGLAEYEERTGEKVDDGQGGSVVTSMIGRFNDAIRAYRVQQLLNALPEDSHFRSEIKPAAIKSLDDAPLNTPEFLDEISKAGVLFDPAEEEDAIDHAGTLCTKRAVMYLENEMGWQKTRILTASKRKFHQNTDLLDVPFSTDFGNIQRMYLEQAKSDGVKIDSWKTLYDGMNKDGTPAPGSIWEKRSKILASIWPDWEKAFDPNGVKPEEYINTIYVPPTLEQFQNMWKENVARAEAARHSAERALK